jgi:hypothetical protein
MRHLSEAPRPSLPDRQAGRWIKVKTGNVRHGRRVEALPLALDDQAVPAVLKREPGLAGGQCASPATSGRLIFRQIVSLAKLFF